MTEKIILESWDQKLEKAEKALKESFWGDFLIGGLLVSGIFIFIESFALPSNINCYTGISLFSLAFFLIISRFIYFRIKKNKIENKIKEAEKCRSDRDYRKALECLNNLLKNSRYLKIKEIWNNKAIALFFLKRYEEAIICFNYALEIDSFYKLAINGKSIIFYKMERWKDALKGFQKAIAIDQYFKEAWYNKGNVMAKLSRYEEALECYDTAVNLDQNYIRAWYNRGNVLIDLKRYDEALESYARILALDQNYKKAWYDKACIESLLNNNDKAIEYLEKAISLDSKYKEKAKRDTDFNNIKNTLEFRKLTNG